jgi:hypothetical protein
MQLSLYVEVPLLETTTYIFTYYITFDSMRLRKQWHLNHGTIR